MERQPRFPMMSLPRSASNWMSNWQNGNRFYTQMCLHITIWCINRMCRPSSWLSRGTRAGTQETNEYRFIPYSGAFGCGRVAGPVLALEVLPAGPAKIRFFRGKPLDLEGFGFWNKLEELPKFALIMI